MKGMEIERKFLVRRLPDGLDTWPKRRIEQAYVSADPVIRARRDGEKYLLTVKGAGLLRREEFEIPLSEASYLRLLEKAEGTPVVKDRYRIIWRGWVIELDIFAPPYAPLMLAEVEFPDEKGAQMFQGPDWFGEEVTYDPRYANAALSARGAAP